MSNFIKLMGRVYDTTAMRAYNAWSVRVTKKAVIALTGVAPEAVDAYFQPLLAKNERIVEEWKRGEFPPSSPAEVVELTSVTVKFMAACVRGTVRRIAQAHEAVGLPYSRELIDVKIDDVEAELLATLPQAVPGFEGAPVGLAGDRVNVYAPKSRLKTDEELAADAAARPSEAECLAAAKRTVCKEPEKLARELGWLPPQQARVFVDYLLTEGSAWTMAACRASLAGPRPVRGPFCWWKKGTPLPNESAEAQQEEEWARAHHRLATALNFDLDAGIDMKVGERAT